jgi:hypothetical protein
MTSIKAGGAKKVTRGWLNRRTKAAIVGALERKGYDRNGLRLAPTNGTPTSNGGDLEGTMNIMVQSPMMRTPWAELQKQADDVVSHLEKKQRWQQRNSPERKDRTRSRRDNYVLLHVCKILFVKY